MNKKSDSKITEMTLLPISLVCAIIGAVIVGVVRVEGIGSKADKVSMISSTHAAEIRSLQEEDRKIITLQNDLVIELSTRLARIEGALGLPEYKPRKSQGGSR